MFFNIITLTIGLMCIYLFSIHTYEAFQEIREGNYGEASNAFFSGVGLCGCFFVYWFIFGMFAASANML